MRLGYLSSTYNPLLCTLPFNDDLLCFGTLEITDQDFGLCRQT